MEFFDKAVGAQTALLEILSQSKVESQVFDEPQLLGLSVSVKAVITRDVVGSQYLQRYLVGREAS